MFHLNHSLTFGLTFGAKDQGTISHVLTPQEPYSLIQTTSLLLDVSIIWGNPYINQRQCQPVGISL